MDALRHAHHLARLVLVWFALSIGVAVASPLVSPQGMALICSGSGAMKVLVKTADGATEASSHSLDCPLCASIGAPPPVARTVAAPTRRWGIWRNDPVWPSSRCVRQPPCRRADLQLLKSKKYSN